MSRERWLRDHWVSQYMPGLPQLLAGLTQQLQGKQSLWRKLHGEEDEELVSSHFILITHFNSPDWAWLNLSQQKKNNLFSFFAKLWTIQGGKTASDYVATYKVFTAAGRHLNVENYPWTPPSLPLILSFSSDIWQREQITEIRQYRTQSGLQYRQLDARQA